MAYEPFSPGDPEPFLADVTAERLRRRDQLAQCYRLFGALRFGDMGDGHISFRDPERRDHFWMLRYGVSFATASREDTVLVSPGGVAIEDRSIGAVAAPINITGYHIHHPIHEARPDIEAAAHVHAPYATAFSTERRLLEPINQEATQFFEDHALFDDEEVQILSADGGKRIAVALDDNSHVILANHGVLTTGKSAAEAVAWLIEMERAAEVALKAKRPVRLSDEASRIAKNDLLRPWSGWQIYNYLIRRHLPNG
ncbi:MAG: class II aldolase/adducin family protein [Acidimicrobiia bacterium]|nr:class II aldolase/adducin family protein [Acidimicrobiia bacterium]NNL27979.1 ribulose phosphate epimerase [Acidimicrobiia bacterium]